MHSRMDNVRLKTRSTSAWGSHGARPANDRVPGFPGGDTIQRSPIHRVLNAENQAMSHAAPQQPDEDL